MNGRKHGSAAVKPASDKVMIGAAARILVGLVFIASGFSKAVAPPQEFAAVMEAYYILSRESLMPLATFLPWAELIIGVFLVAGYLTRFSAACAMVMLAGFFTAILSTQLRGVPLAH